MCRLVGAVFRDRFPIDSLTGLRDVSCSGMVPGREEAGHRDGWGIATFDDGTPEQLGRSTNWACQDPEFETALDQVMLVKPPNILIAHVRAASRGGPRLENTHPFIVGGIVLAHNGTINGYNPSTERTRKGDTDSELLTLVLADRCGEMGDTKRALKSVIRDAGKAGDFSALVLLVSDGKKLYGFRDYSDEKMASYYDLSLLTRSGSVVLFQESPRPLDGRLSQVKKRELVTIGLDLKVEREMLG